MYQVPSAMRLPHRPFWRQIWVLVIGSAGATGYVLAQHTIAARHGGAFAGLYQGLWAGSVIIIGTWSLVGWYAVRWGALHLSGGDILAIVLAPLLFFLGLLLWMYVRPNAVTGLDGILGMILDSGPPWFGTLFLTYRAVLWPRRVLHHAPHESPPA